MIASIRRLTEADVLAAVELQRLCFPAPFPVELLWGVSHLLAHLTRFREGQFVAELDGEIIATASALRISEERWAAHDNWEATVGGFEFLNFDPAGSTLYGADISVHPDHRGKGIARQLYRARFDLVVELGLERFGTACRLPDFCGQTVHTQPLDYAHAVAAGELVDRTLTPLLKMGLSLIDVLSDYMDDAESGNAAALLEWRPRHQTL